MQVEGGAREQHVRAGDGRHRLIAAAGTPGGGGGVRTSSLFWKVHTDSVRANSSSALPCFPPADCSPTQAPSGASDKGGGWGGGGEGRGRGGRQQTGTIHGTWGGDP